MKRKGKEDRKRGEKGKEIIVGVTDWNIEAMNDHHSFCWLTKEAESAENVSFLRLCSMYYITPYYHPFILNFLFLAYALN